MLDIKFIRENKDLVAAGAKKKHVDIDLDALIALDDKRKSYFVHRRSKTRGAECCKQCHRQCKITCRAAGFDCGDEKGQGFT